MSVRTLLVTGGCGFIGSNFTRFWLERHPDDRVIVLDKLTYAGRPENLHDLLHHPRLTLLVGDILDHDVVLQTCGDQDVSLIVHFAAETHVDQSIHTPLAFTRTNALGTHVLLEVARQLGCHFHYASTDEVYGQVLDGQPRVECDALDPRSPYSASKAAGEHLVKASVVTYGLRATITRGSNTVGPYQHVEKAVPLFSTNALLSEPLPVYGDGLQMRDYLHVLDHCAGVAAVLEAGAPGETYNLGAGSEITNMRMAQVILETLGRPFSLIRHVRDRPGHDRRYSMNVSKLRALGWQPRHTAEESIAATARWYAQNSWWWEPLRDGEFRSYYERQYGPSA